MGFVSGDRTRRRSCLLRGQHKHGRSKKLHSNRLHQTCGLVNQQRHVYVKKCPLTMRHVAKRSGDSCGESQQEACGRDHVGEHVDRQTDSRKQGLA